MGLKNSSYPMRFSRGEYERKITHTDSTFHDHISGKLKNYWHMFEDCIKVRNWQSPHCFISDINIFGASLVQRVSHILNQKFFNKAYQFLY